MHISTYITLIVNIKVWYSHHQYKDIFILSGIIIDLLNSPEISSHSKLYGNIIS